MIAFVVVFAVAAGVTGLVAPLVGRLAWRVDAVARPGPRKIHDRPTPQLGGLSMLAGLLAAVGAAWFLPALREAMQATSAMLGVLLGAVLIVGLGVLDDMRGLSPPLKLAGQIVAALGPILLGVQLVYAWLPGVEVVALSSDLGFPLTVLAVVAMINAVNLIDGLDGLAAGVVGIAAVAFFAFADASAGRGIAASGPTIAPLLAAALAGMCAGFLVHNFHPARIFMGDTGSMLLGLLLASAGVSYVGRTTAPSYADFAGSIPLLIPALVLAIPFVDTVFAVLRRLYRKQPVGLADRGHLHHLLMAFGHSHRRAVLVLYYWSAVLAFATVGLSLLSTGLVAWVVLGLVVAGLALTVAGVRHGRVAPPAVPVARRQSG